MTLQVIRDAAAEVENTVLNEGERARNGLRHGLRLLAVAKSWSDTNRLAGEVVPGGGIPKLFKIITLVGSGTQKTLRTLQEFSENVSHQFTVS